MTLHGACAIDVHAHVVPETLPACARRPAPTLWPSMAPAHACHRHVMISGKVYRTVSDRCWSPSRRLADLPAERRPGLRIAFSHGGGTLASLLPRLEQGWQVFPALREAVTASPSSQARKLYYDSLVFDGATLAQLVARFGASQLMLGTDYPFNFHDRTPVERLGEAGFAPAVVEQLAHGNARRFLGARVLQDAEGAA